MSKGIFMKWGILAGLLILAFSTGCTSAGISDISKRSNPPDPETAIISWMDAVNHKDVQRLYLLAPDEIKNQVTYEQFVKANEGNLLFTESGLSFTNYTVLNETGNQSEATISAMLIMQKPVSKNSTNMESVPVFYTFTMMYEDNQWKVWT